MARTFAVVPRSPFRHPRLAQAFERPVPIVEQARIAALIGGLGLVRLPRRDRPKSVIRERKVTLERQTGLRLAPAQSERHNQVSMRPLKIRIDRHRLPGRIYRLT